MDVNQGEDLSLSDLMLYAARYRLRLRDAAMGGADAVFAVALKHDK
jgi:hypothetical protein